MYMGLYRHVISVRWHTYSLVSISFCPMRDVPQDLKLKEKRIQEELDEDGNFPFDLSDGRILGHKEGL